MRHSGKTTVRRARLRDLLPPALLATLVACTNTQLPQDLLYKGPDVLFCDIQKVNGRHCASADERNTGIALTAAAEALVTGQTSSIGLDFSEAALGRCNGEPEAVEFALGQEVGNFGDTSLRVLAEMRDERVFVLVVLEGLCKVGGDRAAGAHDAHRRLSTNAELGIGGEVGRNDFQNCSDHVVAEGVEITECANFCNTRHQSPNVSPG